MPNHCVAPGCKTNYQAKSLQKIAVFRVPSGEKERQLWQRAIPRANFVLKSSHVVCEKHFVEDNIITKKEHRDQFGNVIGVGVYKVPRLKKGAVPTQFPGCPSYLRKKFPQKRKNSVKLQFPEGKKLHPDSSVSDKITAGAEDCSTLCDATENANKLLQPQSPCDTNVPQHNSCDADPSSNLFGDILKGGMVLPEAWYQIVTSGRVKLVCFVKAVTRKEDDILKPVFQKQVFLGEDLIVHLTINGKILNFPNVSRRIRSVNDLENIIVTANSMKVCQGCIPDPSFEEFYYTKCQKDSSGQLRHTECPVVIEEGLQCASCYKLLRAMQRRRQRLNRSKSK